MKRILPIIFSAMLLLGFITGFTVGSETFSFIMYHIGGLGAVGILACIAAAIAGRKGYGFTVPFLLSSALSVVIGLAGALFIPGTRGEDGSIACGGSVSLGVGIIFIVIWAFAKNRAEA